MCIFQFYIHASNATEVQRLHALLIKQDETMSRLTLELERSTQERKELQRLLIQERNQRTEDNAKQHKMLIKLRKKAQALEAQFSQKEHALDQYDKACEKLEHAMQALMEILIRNIKHLDQPDIQTVCSLGIAFGKPPSHTLT